LDFCHFFFLSEGTATETGTEAKNNNAENGRRPEISTLLQRASEGFSVSSMCTSTSKFNQDSTVLAVLVALAVLVDLARQISPRA
jgi:hypothetical protein